MMVAEMPWQDILNGKPCKSGESKEQARNPALGTSHQQNCVSDGDYQPSCFYTEIARATPQARFL
jgi:hypothetical protein